MPNLENLRKQAKQLLRWHRARHYPVAALIIGHSPKFAELSDSEVVDGEFKLADSQDVVARRAGFSSWAELIQGASTLNTESNPSSDRATLIEAEPQLFVSDFAVSCRFYESLGFAVTLTYGNPPFYGQIARDGAKLNLRRVSEPLFDAGLRDREDLLSASITVRNVKELFLEFQAADAVFHRTLHTEPWGARTFVVKDPDGNLILFAE